jgi:hypothetical protein
MEPHDRDDLPQVAQYLAVNQDPQFPRDELIAYARQEIVRRYRADLPVELRDAPLDQLVEAVGAQRRAHDPTEAHRVLAELPCPLIQPTDALAALVEFVNPR